MPDWRNARRCLVLGGALLALGGCYKATFVNPSVAPGPRVEEWTDFYLLGMVGQEEFDVRRFCPGEVAMIRTGGNVATDVITGLTFGIYAPRKLYVTCAAPAQAPPASTPAVPALPSAPKPQPVAPVPPPASAPVPTIEVPR
ncbi:MAG: hypothetical protein HY898_19475 [Deltaproteobacteria bacterium]|nr:hypothetical protein [Deltaproteobacteria bacterium]